MPFYHFLARLALLWFVHLVTADYCPLPWPFSCTERPQVGNCKRMLITPELYREIESIRLNGDIKGLSVSAVSLSGDGTSTVVEHDGWGVQSESGEAVTSETRFYLASASKSFVAASLGILMDDFAQATNVTALPPAFESANDFNWHTKINDLLPGEWGLMDEWAHEKASLRDILSHVSGLPRYSVPFFN